LKKTGGFRAFSYFTKWIIRVGSIHVKKVRRFTGVMLITIIAFVKRFFVNP
jgi:hypothetical protein